MRSNWVPPRQREGRRARNPVNDLVVLVYAERNTVRRSLSGTVLSYERWQNGLEEQAAPLSHCRSLAISQLDQTQGAHTLGDPHEPGDICAKHIIAGRAVVFRRFSASIMNVVHDFGQPPFGLFERPSVA